MAPRFSRPRLIDAADKQYRAFLAKIMLGKDNQRPTRPPRARELFGGEAEAALREWLGQQLTLSDRRIVEYMEHRGRSAIMKYRELDAVAVEDKAVQVFEIKASQKATSLRRASRQLRDTRAILGLLHRNVTTTILLVDTGIPSADEVAALMREPDAPAVPPPTLDDVLATLPHVQLVASLDERPADQEQISLIRFSVDDIIALAGAENLHLDWDEDDDEIDDQEADQGGPPADAEAAPQDEDDQDGGAMGEALRRALEQRDKKQG